MGLFSRSGRRKVKPQKRQHEWLLSATHLSTHGLGWHRICPLPIFKRVVLRGITTMRSASNWYSYWSSGLKRIPGNNSGELPARGSTIFNALSQVVLRLSRRSGKWQRRGIGFRKRVVQRMVESNRKKASFSGEDAPNCAPRRAIGRRKASEPVFRFFAAL